MAFRFLLFFHFIYNGVSLLSFWLNRHPCRGAFWNLLNTIKTKLKKLCKPFLRHLLTTRFITNSIRNSTIHILGWVLWVKAPRNTNNRFFVKSYYLSVMAHCIRESTCDSTLTKLRHNMLKAMNKGEITLLVLTDYFKTFDNVDYKLIIAKLWHLNYSEQALLQMVCYLYT